MNLHQRFHERTGLPYRHSASHVASHICMALLIGAALIVVFGSAVMYLWNAVMPALLGVAHITFWHALALLLLARILVGGFHRGGFGHRFGGRFGRHAAHRQYEDWWREVGEQSYRDFSATRPTEGK
jgi:hypothetical protein